ncbi:ABC transporter ATP-binding protein [Labedella phragmitis]|uniref:ABC transporter ATP-binding protein n=1 Tax=Labedella phragmitis TaxID=2498849 RepID=A0A3S3ZSF8_9MICO|nr:ABC transporter ATP-binding protein [Labedella phragmitis]RWZ52666.1 ABC transporter ATP-binding protein [Labedella phragmitis]
MPEKLIPTDPTPSASTAVLRVRDLSVEFGSGTDWKAVTHDVSFDVRAGETVALVGESGSGKSVTAMSVLDLLPGNARRRGTIELSGEDLIRTGAARMRAVRGSEVGVVFQEPMTALNPVYTIGTQLRDVLRAHGRLSRSEADRRALDLLRLVNLPDPERRLGQYPHQLSGGQRQRAMIAMAISGDPKLLIADEPTTALDVTAQAEILDLLLDLQAQLDMALLLITHDMGVVADMATHVVVMKDGRVVEDAPTARLFAAPEHAYTRELLDSVPFLGRSEIVERQPTVSISVVEPDVPEAMSDEAGDAVLEVRDLVIRYPGRFGEKPFVAVDHVDLRVGRGDVVGLVGESGSGKSTIGRAAIGLVPVTSGSIRVADVDLASATRTQMRSVRREASIVFQDPASSLDPRATIGASIAAPLRWNDVEKDARVRTERARELLELVRLPADWVDRYPHELSGGQRQRVGIARALAVRPSVLIADEPTSALDVSVQASVLRLLLELQAELGFSCLFISHDLSVVERLATRVVVLNRGRVEEQGDTRQILHHPREEYTRRLIQAVPVPDPVVQADRRRLRLEEATAS